MIRLCSNVAERCVSDLGQSLSKTRPGTPARRKDLEVSLRGKKSQTDSKPSGDNVEPFARQDSHDSPNRSFEERVARDGHFPGDKGGFAARFTSQGALPGTSTSFVEKVTNQSTTKKPAKFDNPGMRALLRILAESEPGKNWLFSNLDRTEEELIALTKRCLNPEYVEAESFYSNLLLPAYEHNFKFGKNAHSNKVPEPVLALLTTFAVKNLPEYLVEDSNGIKLLEIAFAGKKLDINGITSNKEYRGSLAQLLELLESRTPEQLEELIKRTNGDENV